MRLAERPLHVLKSKEELRREALFARRTSPLKNRLILDYLLSLNEFKRADLILTYVSTDGEIDTHELLTGCFAAKSPLQSEKRVAVPKIVKTETNVSAIEFYEIKSLSDLEKSNFGILEPVNSCKKAQINNSGHIFCVIPALVCNPDGFRVGYGKGYYDRFLADYAGESAVLCYLDNIREFPVEPHDRAASIIVTEEGVIYVGR